MRIDTLPVDAVLPDLCAALEDAGTAILVAPPGAGKTTRVPPALLDAGFMRGQTIRVIEPRRLAARAAAARMADERGEAVGQTVGYRVRLESRVSERTRIEVVTGGVFRRQILEDGELTGIGAVLFDEFHERALDTDIGFALVRDVQAALREDLRVLIMSATLDAAALADRLGGVPVIACEGRMHPVETRYRPRPADRSLENHAAATVLQALASEAGDVLCFLPGQRDIERTADRLADRLPPSVTLHRLSGAVDRTEQDAAIRPAPSGARKVVLSTAIAETSLTIQGVRIVIDSGLSRVPVHDAGSGMTRLQTVRAALSSVDQRRGRAGRTEPGLCLRLWHEGQTGSLPARPDPEIRQAHLAGAVLDVGLWGVSDPAALPWLDAPPPGAWAEAVSLLKRIGALSEKGQVTAAGRRIGHLPLHPRLAHMIGQAAVAGFPVTLAADLAAVLSDPGLTGRGIDLRARLRTLRGGRAGPVRALRRQAAAWARAAGGGAPEAPGDVDTLSGVLLSFAYPDRIAQARGKDGRFKLANGKGADLDLADPLASESYLVVADLSGTAARARILLAAPIALADLLQHFDAEIEERETVEYDADRDRVISVVARQMGALVLKSATRPAPPGPSATALLLDVVAARGFELLDSLSVVENHCARIAFLRAEDGAADWPDETDTGLRASLNDWLAPFLAGTTALREIPPDAVRQALRLRLGPELCERMDRLAPPDIVLPSGRVVDIDYRRDGGPGIVVRPHDVFGRAPHPAILGGGHALTVTLVSPAGRPVQVTRDLPGFWAGSWRDVRSDLKARYPKHDWPENPADAAPSTDSVKRR